MLMNKQDIEDRISLLTTAIVENEEEIYFMENEIEELENMLDTMKESN